MRVTVVHNTDVDDQTESNREKRVSMKAPNESAGDLPKVHDLKDMLQYQDKSIVSRMLAKNSGGSVTLFASTAAKG